MDCRSQKLPPMSPFLMGAEQESGAKPRLEVDVLSRLADQRVAAQDRLRILGMVKPDLSKIL